MTDNAHSLPSPAVGPSSGVFAVAPDKDFLRAVAQGILERSGGDPLKLADYTVLVPNREIGAQLKQAFADLLEAPAGIMPRIDAPGDIDDNYLSLTVSGNRVLSQALMDIPPPVDRLHRQMILAGEILKIPGMASSAQKAVILGGELGCFLDEVQRNDIELKNIDTLAAPSFRKQWAHTAEFLKIITETWPAKLQEMGKIDPEEHKNALFRIQAAHWRQDPPRHPVIAAGFSDAAPATLDLLQAVASMPQGCVILPGVDTELDQKSWDILTPVHPQFAIKKILSALNADRAGVGMWAATKTPKDIASRSALLREAMRPAGTAESWGGLKAKRKAKQKSALSAEALSGMDLAVCGTPQEEASIIALKMREALETPGKTATLVTADRSLARRVAARLRHWKIDVADGAGKSLVETPAGIYLLATAQMAAEEWAPVPFLEALKHPLSALGEDHNSFERKLAKLEDAVLHGPRPGPGAKGMKESLSTAFNRAARRRGGAPDPAQAAQDKAELEGLIDSLDSAGKAFFEKMKSRQPLPFHEFLDEHIRFAEALARDDKMKGASRLWRGDDGVRAARFLSHVRDVAQHMPKITGADYADVLGSLLRGVTVNPSVPPHPALKILTPEQARLSKADIVIIGGLNDDVWPRRPDENPWLSPEMIQNLGLPVPEEAVGRDAHRFVQAVSNPDVLITRAVRDGDSPTVASPFLTRLEMVLKGAGLSDSLGNGGDIVDINLALHTPPAVTPISAPAPTPPVSARPKELPVTGVEALMHDPYAFYARNILRLYPRAPLDAAPNALERGTLIHAALDVFVKKYPDKLPEKAAEELLKIGAETFGARMSSTTVQSFWWPRFERVAKWFVHFENERREMTKTLGTEVRGKLDIDLGGGDKFTLTCIADRVDLNEETGLEVIDYKTGGVPAQKDVAQGFYPQLTLEALIAFKGGMKDIDPQDVGQLQYWKLTGGRPAGEIVTVKGDVKKLMEEAEAGLKSLMKAFNDPKTPYLASPWKGREARYHGYGHLARSGEWATVQKVDPQKKKKKPLPKSKKRGPKA